MYAKVLDPHGYKFVLGLDVTNGDFSLLDHLLGEDVPYSYVMESRAVGLAIYRQPRAQVRPY